MLKILKYLNIVFQMVSGFILSLSLASLYRIWFKGVISSKDQFPRQNANFISFWSTWPLLDLFLESCKSFSVENHKVGHNKTAKFFTDISVVFTNNTVIRKYWLSENTQLSQSRNFSDAIVPRCKRSRC